MNAPIFVVSDLHMGSGGTRDSFSQYNRDSDFNDFLDYVEKEDGELIILGDFIDMWRFALKKVIKMRCGLMDRLAEMRVCYIPGNHDRAITKFINCSEVPHPLFRKIKKPFVRIIGDKKFSFIHGHELDPMNQKLTPRIGRALGLSSSLVEYAKGYPVFPSGAVEAALLSIEERIYLIWLNFIRQLKSITKPDYSTLLQNTLLLPRQKRIKRLLSKYELRKKIDGHDISISAHTHQPCRFQNWYFNSGSWTNQKNNFIRILPDGKAEIFDWEKGRPKYNDVVIETSQKLSGRIMTYQTVN